MARVICFVFVLACILGCRSVGTVTLKDCAECTVILRGVDIVGEVPKTVDVKTDAQATVPASLVQ